MDFLDRLDTFFVVQQEILPDKGEDSFLCLHRDHSAIAGVFDGCGGLGALQYPGFREHTGAYIASRLVSGAVHDWYSANGDAGWESSRQMVDQLRAYIDRNLALGPQYGNSSLRIRGSMVRPFPTTLAMVLVRQEGEVLTAHVIWAGDSRVYLLDEKGLAQLTSDDCSNEDALSNLSNDGELTNVLCADGKYSLHVKRLRLHGPAMVFAATDGTYGYLPSPMEFEYTMVKALAQAESIRDLRSKLWNSFHATTGDDFALSFLGFDFGTWEAMQAFGKSRAYQLENQYILPLERDRSQVQALWEQYRICYERYLAGKRV